MDSEMNEKVQSLIDDIKEPLKEIQRLQDKRIGFVDEKIEYLLINKVNNKKEIERLLDELLDIAYWDSESMRDPFNRLKEFYKKIDTANTKLYEKYYMEIVEGD